MLFPLCSAVGPLLSLSHWDHAYQDDQQCLHCLVQWWLLYSKLRQPFSSIWQSWLCRELEGKPCRQRGLQVQRPWDGDILSLAQETEKKKEKSCCSWITEMEGHELRRLRSTGAKSHTWHFADWREAWHRAGAQCLLAIIIVIIQNVMVPSGKGAGCGNEEKIPGFKGLSV